jgi:hypothetical protein
MSDAFVIRKQAASECLTTDVAETGIYLICVTSGSSSQYPEPLQGKEGGLSMNSTSDNNLCKTQQRFIKPSRIFELLHFI